MALDSNVAVMGVLWMTVLTLNMVNADLTKKVYCKKACEDYLRIDERLMKVCGEQDLSALQCGSVITCESPSADDIYNRPNGSTQFANNVTCCYSITYTERGACDRISEGATKMTTQNLDGMELHLSGWACAMELMRRYWPLLGLLMMLLVLETTFVMWRLCTSLCRHGKGARLADSSCNDEHTTLALTGSSEPVNNANAAHCCDYEEARKDLIRQV